ncbi:MAG: hypothetical protein LBV41_04470 [Cytophagaceae bacterium]|jgi:uncharacterized membrane protein YhaH (DUF805 family)|nr:hypothetical protein [Cytophagaceae bacterium]
MKHSIYYRQIAAIFWAILALLLILFFVSIKIANSFNHLSVLSASELSTLKTVIIILAFGSIPATISLHARRMKKVPPAYPIDEKLRLYRNSYFLKTVTLEALKIIALIGYLLSSDKVFLIIFVILLVAFLINFPNRYKIHSELGIDTEDNI